MPKGSRELLNSGEDEEDPLPSRVAKLQTHGVEAHSSSGEELDAMDLYWQDLEASNGVTSVSMQEAPEGGNRLVEGPGVASFGAALMGFCGVAGSEKGKKQLSGLRESRRRTELDGARQGGI